jgi:hypothetical protein
MVVPTAINSMHQSHAQRWNKFAPSRFGETLRVLR